MDLNAGWMAALNSVEFLSFLVVRWSIAAALFVCAALVRKLMFAMPRSGQDLGQP